MLGRLLLQSRGTFRLDLAALMLALAAIAASLILYREDILSFHLGDPDDALRLVQVRDLLAGQGWFDTNQYRINPLFGGGQMHWSRFIDVQIAALIAFFSLFLSPERAELWAIALYPPLLILPLLVLISRILGRLCDRREHVAGLLIAASGATFLHYFAPLRLDHHNWQLLLAVALAWIALGRANALRGVAAALVIALHLEISLEGLPYLLLFGALFAVSWLRHPETAPRLFGFAAGLAVLPAFVRFAFHGPAGFTAIHCDAFTLPYVAATASAALCLLAWLRVPSASATVQLRAVGLVVAAVVGGAAFLLTAGTCLSGPFGALEPLVRLHWYERVMEGQPVWAQSADAALFYLAPSLVGFAAAAWAWRQARGTSRAHCWDIVLFITGGSFLLSLFIFRTGAVTHAYLVPAFGVMAIGLWDWSRSQRSLPARLVASLAIIFAIPAVDLLVAAKMVRLFVPSASAVEPQEADDADRCPSRVMIEGLARLPSAHIFAPIDVGPAVLVHSGHSVIATAHHRNHAAMNVIIHAFLADPAAAMPGLRASKARYLVLCNGSAEIKNYASASPGGLAAALARGRPVAGLDLQPQLSRGPLLVFRIEPMEPTGAGQAGRNASAAPFMQ